MCVQNAMDLPAVGAYESLMNQNVMVAQLAQMQQDQQQVMMRQAAQNRVVAAQSVAAHQKAAQVSHSSFPSVFIAKICCTPWTKVSVALPMCPLIISAAARLQAALSAVVICPQLRHYACQFDCELF
jgi:hypothetical protein